MTDIQLQTASIADVTALVRESYSLLPERPQFREEYRGFRFDHPDPEEVPLSEYRGREAAVISRVVEKFLASPVRNQHSLLLLLKGHSGIGKSFIIDSLLKKFSNEAELMHVFDEVRPLLPQLAGAPWIGGHVYLGTYPSNKRIGLELEGGKQPLLALSEGVVLGLFCFEEKYLNEQQLQAATALGLPIQVHTNPHNGISLYYLGRPLYSSASMMGVGTRQEVFPQWNELENEWREAGLPSGLKQLPREESPVHYDFWTVMHHHHDMADGVMDPLLYHIADQYVSWVESYKKFLTQEWNMQAVTYLVYGGNVMMWLGLFNALGVDCDLMPWEVVCLIRVWELLGLAVPGLRSNESWNSLNYDFQNNEAARNLVASYLSETYGYPKGDIINTIKHKIAADPEEANKFSKWIYPKIDQNSLNEKQKALLEFLVEDVARPYVPATPRKTIDLSSMAVRNSSHPIRSRYASYVSRNYLRSGLRAPVTIVHGAKVLSHL